MQTAVDSGKQRVLLRLHRTLQYGMLGWTWPERHSSLVPVVVRRLTTAPCTPHVPNKQLRQVEDSFQNATLTITVMNHPITDYNLDNGDGN